MALDDARTDLRIDEPWRCPALRMADPVPGSTVAADDLKYGLEVNIREIEIIADFRNEPGNAVAARLCEIAGMFERAAAKLAG